MIAMATTDFMLNQSTPKLPSGSPLWWQFNNSFVNEELIPEELVEKVSAGYCITAQHQHVHTQKPDGKKRAFRHREHFIRGQHACLDYDNGNKSLDDLLGTPLIGRYAYAIHETPSSREDARKWRVLFLFDKPIGNRSKYAEATAALPWRFKTAGIDTAMKDPMRFYYGAKPGGIMHIVGNVMGLQAVADELVLPYRAAKEKARKIVANPATVISDKRAAAHLSSMMAIVSSAPDGQKHHTLNLISYTLGGYVSGGVFDYTTVVNAMQKAIAANPNGVKNLKAAYKTVEVAVRSGMLSPLYYEEATGTVQIAESVSVDYASGFADGIVVGYAMAKANIPPGFPERVGLDSSLANYFGFEYRPKTIDEDTGEIIDEAVAINYRAGSETINTEYRCADGRCEYAADTPALFPTDNERFGQPALIIPDTIEAIRLWATSQARNIFGATNLPFHTGVKDMAGTDDVVALAWPGHPPVDDSLPRLDLPVKPSKFAGLDRLLAMQLH